MSDDNISVTSVHVPYPVSALYHPLGAVELPRPLPVQTGVPCEAAVVEARVTD